jgi:hypothetical protein
MARRSSGLGWLERRATSVIDCLCGRMQALGMEGAFA